MGIKLKAVNIVDIDQKLIDQLKCLDNNKLYYLSADEGGMIGSPKFEISVSKKLRPYYLPVAKLNKFVIRDYIIGRLCTWFLAGNGDYTDSYVLTIDVSCITIKGK